VVGPAESGIQDVELELARYDTHGAGEVRNTTSAVDHELERLKPADAV
jgi:hypothetical protein